MADDILPFPSDVAMWRRGAELAFTMLKEIEACSLEETAYDGQFRDHRPQANIVAGYMAKLRDVADSRCELAFSAILTDHIASSMHAGEPCLENCRRAYARIPIATTPLTGADLGGGL